MKPSIHYATKNDSFILMHKILKDRGVKNNKFFLLLFNTSLENVDPYSPTLTNQEKIDILAEIRMNPWYFFREICRIPEPGGYTRFRLHLGNLSLIFLLLQNINVIEVLPRQQGKTQSTAAIFVYIYHFNTSNSQFVFGNKALDDAKLNLKRMKEQVALLPKFLINKHKGDIDNLESIKSSKTGNSIKVIGSANDESASDKLGRGLTVPCLWLDEMAFLKYNSFIYESATLAVSQASIAAKRNNKPYFKIITTTPNNRDVTEGSYCMSMIESSCRFELEMYDSSLEQLRILLAENSSNDFFYLEYSYLELGKTEEWFKEQCRAVNHNRQTIKRELLLEWPSSTDASIFTEDLLDNLNNFKLPVIYTRIIHEKYLLNFIKPHNPFKPYIIGIDVAGGLSKDHSTAIVVDPSDMEPVAFFYNNRIDLPDFQQFIIELSSVHFPSSALAIENAPIALSTIQALVKSPLKNKIIYTYTDDVTKEKEVSPRFNKGTLVKHKRYGIVTSNSSRQLMIDLLQHEVANNPQVFRIALLIKEIACLERNKQGKIEHASGMHDDLLMAYLVARYALAYIPHISRFIAIDSAAKANALMQISTINHNYDLYKKHVDFTNSVIPIQNIDTNTRQGQLLKILSYNNR